MMNVFVGDPIFATDGYHLTANSVAIDLGVETQVDTDIDGEARDSRPDLGADEVSKEPTVDIYLPMISKGGS